MSDDNLFSLVTAEQRWTLTVQGDGCSFWWLIILLIFERSFECANTDMMMMVIFLMLWYKQLYYSYVEWCPISANYIDNQILRFILNVLPLLNMILWHCIYCRYQTSLVKVIYNLYIFKALSYFIFVNDTIYDDSKIQVSYLMSLLVVVDTSNATKQPNKQTAI